MNYKDYLLPLGELKESILNSENGWITEGYSFVEDLFNIHPNYKVISGTTLGDIRIMLEENYIDYSRGMEGLFDSITIRKNDDIKGNYVLTVETTDGKESNFRVNHFLGGTK